MILVDANQIAISHLMVRSKIEDGINIESVRKSIVRVIGRIAKKYGPEYGQMVLCYDDKNYWRREVFPFYKKNRKQEREASKYDWDQVFSVLNIIRDELRGNFPYKVLQVQGAEADDIVASLCMDNSKSEAPEKVLILSADKDFIQLHKYDFVRQYDPIRNRWIENDDPVMYLQEHIIRGDRSDGIPNILTCDDAIVTGKPQKKMSKDKIASLANMSPDEFTNFIRLRNWKRNAELIDFGRIPESVVERILNASYHARVQPSVNLNYFIDNQLQDILSDFS
ncbi:ribonuclease H [Synechococcus phage S-CREM2]|nr:ribonuclease H [Synechococcus phage S-CREM2]